MERGEGRAEQHRSTLYETGRAACMGMRIEGFLHGFFGIDRGESSAAGDQRYERSMESNGLC